MSLPLTNTSFYSIYVEERAISLRVEAEDYAGNGRFLSTQKDYESARRFASDLAKSKKIEFLNHVEPTGNWQP